MLQGVQSHRRDASWWPFASNSPCGLWLLSCRTLQWTSQTYVGIQCLVLSFKLACIFYGLPWVDLQGKCPRGQHSLWQCQILFFGCRCESCRAHEWTLSGQWRMLTIIWYLKPIKVSIFKSIKVLFFYSWACLFSFLGLLRESCGNNAANNSTSDGTHRSIANHDIIYNTFSYFYHLKKLFQPPIRPPTGGISHYYNSLLLAFKAQHSLVDMIKTHA